jgi:hypothetical protein
MRAARRMPLFALPLLLLAALSVPGCGGGSKSTSTSGRLAIGAEATACAALTWELKRFQAANDAAEKESSGTSGSVLTSIEGIKGAVKQLVNSPDVALSQKARVVEETLSAYERQGQESVIQHLTGKQAWKASTPTLTELCP